MEKAFIPLVAAFLGAYIGAYFAHTSTLRAEFTKLEVETNVRLSEYLLRAGAGDSLDEYEPEELEEPGLVIQFDVVIEGFKGRRCTVRWVGHSAATRSPIPDFWEEPIELVPEADLDRAGDFFWGPLPDEWIPFPDEEFPFFIRLELYDDKGVRLAYRDTDVITQSPL